MNTQIIEMINVSREITWNSWAVQYFFLIGISIGGMLLSMPAFVFRRRELESMGRIGLVVALSTGLVAPVALVSDLHQPARFYQFYLHFTPSSWMSWGSFFLPAYLLSLLAYAFSVYRAAADREQAVIRMLGGITLLTGLLVALYTGSEMGILISRPLWNTAWLGVLFLITAMSGAAGMGLLLNRFLGNDEFTALKLKRYMFIYLLLGIVLQLTWMFAGLMGLSQSGEQLMRLGEEYLPLDMLFFGLFLGGIVPLGLSAGKSGYAWLAGFLAVFGAWMFRWNMFIGGQGIPKNAAGFYFDELTFGTEDVLGIIGSLGLWVVLLLLIIRFLPLQKRKTQA